MLLFGSHPIEIHWDKRLLFFFSLLVLKHLFHLCYYYIWFRESFSHILLFCYSQWVTHAGMDGLLLSHYGSVSFEGLHVVNKMVFILSGPCATIMYA